MEYLKTEVEEGFSIEWKAFSLEQQNSTQGKDFMMWEHPEYPSKGIPALVAAKAAKNQGESSFLNFHMAAYKARHDDGEDIADRQVLRDIAKSVDLDLDRFEKDMDRDETWQQVGKDHMESKDTYDVFGVPTLVFGRGQAVFVKLQWIPESKEERISLLELIRGMGAEMPFLLELKRP